MKNWKSFEVEGSRRAISSVWCFVHHLPTIVSSTWVLAIFSAVMDRSEHDEIGDQVNLFYQGCIIADISAPSACPFPQAHPSIGRHYLQSKPLPNLPV